MKIVVRCLFVLVGLAFLAEVGVRLSGITDFPLYDANPIIGYIPKASQAGAFLNKNKWYFNEKSMGASAFKPTDRPDVLLIGDSVVLGGNPYSDYERLGPQLARALKEAVWPISAGSWSLVNEVTYLKLNPDVVAGVDRIIFVLNSDDFAAASSWACEENHPRSRPLSAVVYVFRKYVHELGECSTPLSELHVPPADWKVVIRLLNDSPALAAKPLLFVLYPKRTEVQNRRLLEENLEAYAYQLRSVLGKQRGSYVSVARDPRWNDRWYRDTIHPTVEGTKVLAEIISRPNDGAVVQ